MMATSSAGRHTFDEPATYRIQIEGALEPAWSARLEGMEIAVTLPAEGPPVTTLTGYLSDQAALVGILDQLYTWQFPVISVLRIRANC